MPYKICHTSMFHPALLLTNTSEPVNIGQVCSTVPCNLGYGNRTAVSMIKKGDLALQTMTYQELEDQSNQVANLLTACGLSTGSLLYLYLPKTIDYYPAFLGALKAGIRVCPLFSNFGPEALADRIGGNQAMAIITVSNLLPRLKKALQGSTSLPIVFVLDWEADEEASFKAYKPNLSRQPKVFNPISVEDYTPAVLHYTSGSTGKPKGVQHVHKAVRGIQKAFLEVMKPSLEDIYWCTADPSWVVGVSYGIIAPLSLGMNLIQFEGVFNVQEWMQIIEQYGVNILYSAPTVFRMMMRDETIDFSQYDFSQLKAIFSTGEPLNPEVYHWGLKNFRQKIYDVWYQTETASPQVANTPDIPVKPGSMGKAVQGIEVAIMDEQGKVCEPGIPGKLTIKAPWDSMFVAYLGREDLYNAKFKNGYYYTGDLARMDEDGYFWFLGRDDDIINTSGHLVSPIEVESCLIELAEVAEVAVIGAPDELTWEKVVAFVKLAKGVEWSKKIELRFKTHVFNKVSSLAMPSDIVVVDHIPKTNSGKIMRRLLKKIYLGEDPGDVSSLEEV